MESSFFVKDNIDKCEVSLQNENSTIYIENSSNKKIHFFSIDNCLIKSVDIKKCDAAITDNKFVIVFIEIKEITYTNDGAKDRRKKAKHCKKAVEQLASTINDFKQNGIDLDSYRVEAIISFPPLISQTNPTTIPLASSQARISQFQRLCGYSNLNQGNHLVF